MLLYLTIAAFCGLSALSKKRLDNPLAFLGLGYVAFCVALCAGVLLKAVGLSL